MKDKKKNIKIHWLLSLFLIVQLLIPAIAIAVPPVSKIDFFEREEVIVEDTDTYKEKK